jgi:hypothetical protein
VLLAGEVLVFVVLIQCSVVTQSLGVASVIEVAAGSEAKDAELLSYNAMLDLCLNLKEFVPSLNMSDPNVSSQIQLEVDQWNTNFTRYVDNEMNGDSLIITVSNISFEPYNGQAIDQYQMNYVGKTGNEKWHIFGSMSIKVSNSWMTELTNFNISIIA